MKPSVLKPLSMALFAVAMAASSLSVQAASPSTSKAAEASLNNEDWYQVWTENQAVLFDDQAVYFNYLKTGKAPALKDLGVKDFAGRAVVLGLSTQEQGKDANSLTAKRFLDINLPPATDFYGEIRQDNKIYVFKRYGDMIDVMKLGSPTFSFMELGGGSNGERVIYVLQKEEAKPDALIKKFHSLNH